MATETMILTAEDAELCRVLEQSRNMMAALLLRIRGEWTDEQRAKAIRIAAATAA